MRCTWLGTCFASGAMILSCNPDSGETRGPGESSSGASSSAGSRPLDPDDPPTGTLIDLSHVGSNLGGAGSGSGSWPSYHDVVGAPGWQNSSAPLCEATLLPGFLDIWADERGVFALLSTGCDRSVLDARCPAFRTSVWINDSTGWKALLEAEVPLESYQILGAAGGDLWLTGVDCGVYRLGADGKGGCVEPGSRGGTLALQATQPILLAGDQLLRQQGETFEPWAALPRTGNSLFAVQDWVVVGSENRVFLVSDETAQVNEMPLPPAGTYAAVWARSPSDVWLGSRAGWLVHFDGSSWKSHPFGELGAVNEFWGTGDVLYFQSSLGFGRIEKDGVPEVLWVLGENDSMKGLHGLFGRSEKEIFLVGSSKADTEVDGACAPVVNIFFDGEVAHEF